MAHRLPVKTLTSVVLTSLMGMTTSVFGDEHEYGYGHYKHYPYKHFKAYLNGYNEVPSVSTEASGQFKARLDKDREEIYYELTYGDLEGELCQVHIHFGQSFANGGISVWFCGNGNCETLPTAPDDLAACPQDGSSIEGTFGASDVVGPSPQGIEPEEFDELLEAMKAGLTYVNMHTTRYENGEIRGQIEKDKRKGHHHGRHYRKY